MASYRPTKNQSDKEIVSGKGRIDHRREAQWHAQQVDDQDAEDLRVLGSETVEKIQRHDRASSTHGQTQVMDGQNTAVLCCFTKAHIAMSLKHQ